MKPLVSVIIPNYNRALYIADCIQSVYEQSHRPIELIVVDDGSTDNSIQIITDCQTKLNNSGDFRLVILQQKNSGANRARNYGFEQSKGQYIQWLDSDDLLLPHKIASQIHVFTKATDVVYSRAQFFNEVPDNLMDKYWGRIPKGNSSDYFEFPWQTMCALYKKTILDQFGVWQEDLSLSDDWELAMRYKIKSRVEFLDEISSLYRDHKGDRVGNNLSIQKINSLTSVLMTTYALSKENNLIDNYLKKRYFSRLTYCFMQSGALGGYDDKIKLWRKLVEINRLKAILLIPLIFAGKSVFKFFLKVFKKIAYN